MLLSDRLRGEAGARGDAANSTALVSERAFEPAGAEAIVPAERIVLQCNHLICTIQRFATMHCGNRRLLEFAAGQGILLPVDSLGGLEA